MRKIIAITFVTLDGVIQAPGGPKEDTSGILNTEVGQFPTLMTFLAKS